MNINSTIYKVNENRILKSVPFLTFMVFVLYVPAMILGRLNSNGLLPALRILRYIAYAVFAIKFLYYVYKKKKLPIVVIFLALFEVYKLIITSYTNGFPSAISLTLSYLSEMVFIVLLNIEIENNPKNIIKALAYFYMLYSLMNLVGVIICTDYSIGRSYWVFGEDNSHIPYYIIGFTISGLNACLEKSKPSNVFFVLYVLISMFAILYRFCATAVFSYLVLLFLFAFSFLDKKGKFINSVTLVFTNIIMFVSIVVFKLEKYFSFIIRNFFGKSITFSGRREIYDVFIDKIDEYWIFGKGYINVSLPILYANNKLLNHYAHNLYLNSLFCGGLFSSFLILTSLILSMIKVYTNRYSKISKILSCSLFAFLTASLMESYEMIHYFIICSLCVNIKHFLTC